MNFKMIINFLLVVSIVGTIVFFYSKEISVIEKNSYVDLSNRLVGNNEIENIDDYINKNNITYIKVNAKNLDLNRIAQLSLDNSQNITFQVIDSDDTIDENTLLLLVNKYKQIILGETKKDYAEILKQNGNNFEIHLGEMSNDLDLFQILFLLKNKNIKKLTITGINKLNYSQNFIDYFLKARHIEELYLYDEFEYDQYISLHKGAGENNKKVFFSQKSEIEILRNLKKPPKDLLLDYISGGLEVKDILDIHSIFGDHEFDVLSIKQNKTEPSPELFFIDKYKYSINLEMLNNYIQYKKANLVGYNIKFNKGFDICKQQKILYVSNIQSIQNNICGTYVFTFDWETDRELFTNQEASLFIKSIFDFMITKNYLSFEEFIYPADKTEKDYLFEEFWLLFNTKQYFYNNKPILPENINIISGDLLKVKNNKEKFKILYRGYIEKLSGKNSYNDIYLKLSGKNSYADVYLKYYQYNKYSKEFQDFFSLQTSSDDYFEYLQGKKEYFDLNFYNFQDNRNNNGVLIFYTKKDE